MINTPWGLLAYVVGVVITVIIAFVSVAFGLVDRVGDGLVIVQRRFRDAIVVRFGRHIRRSKGCGR